MNSILSPKRMECLLLPVMLSTYSGLYNRQKYMIQKDIKSDTVINNILNLMVD